MDNTKQLRRALCERVEAFTSWLADHEPLLDKTDSLIVWSNAYKSYAAATVKQADLFDFLSLGGLDKPWSITGYTSSTVYTAEIGDIEVKWSVSVTKPQPPPATITAAQLRTHGGEGTSSTI